MNCHPYNFAAATSIARCSSRLLLVLLVLLSVVLSGPRGVAENRPAPLLTTDAIVTALMTANARRAAAMRGYHGKRSYHVRYSGFFGARDAEMQVEASYTAPNHKDFKVISQSGSKILLNHVLLKLLDSEKEAIQESNRRQMELSPKNYEFTWKETQDTPDGQMYVLAVVPREKTKFLYRGNIWVDARDFAVVRMEGEPAKNPSLWISRTFIKHQYKKIGEFWLPFHNESTTQVRLGGRSVLTIDYTDYQITSVGRGASPHGIDKNPVLPDPSSVIVDQH